MAKRSKPTTGSIDFQGLPIRIEYSPGDRRYYSDNKFVTMRAAYGEIKKTLGVDGDPVDVYVGPHLKSKRVFVIKQMKVGNFEAFDEEKCMLGTNSAEEAKALYLAHYSDPKFFGGIKELTMDEFKKRLETKGTAGEKLALAIGDAAVFTTKAAAKNKNDYAVNGGRLGTSLGLLGGLQASEVLSRGRPPSATNLLLPLFGGALAGGVLGKSLGARYDKQSNGGGGVTVGRDALLVGGGSLLGALAARHGGAVASGAVQKAKQMAPMLVDRARVGALLGKEAPGAMKDQLAQSHANLGAAISALRGTPAKHLSTLTEKGKKKLLIGGIAAGGAAGAAATKRMDRDKRAAEDRHTRIADRVDDVGIGLLAAPYVAKGLSKHLAHRPGVLGAVGRGANAVAHHMEGHNRYELAGLGLVAPGIVHHVAHGVERATPTKVAFLGALKRVAAPVLSKLRPAATPAAAGGVLTAKNMGKAALAGTAGLGAYGAYKGINAASHMVSGEGAVAPPPNYLGPRLF